MILSIVVALSFFGMGFYMTQWDSGRMGDIGEVERYRQSNLLKAAMASVWEYYVTDRENEIFGNYYPYFNANPGSVAFVTTSPIFSDGRSAAARLRIEDGEAGRHLVYEEAPFEGFYIRYSDDEINYRYSLRLDLLDEPARFRYYGLVELVFLPEQEVFQEIFGWSASYNVRQYGVMPEIIEIVKQTDENDKVQRFEIIARNRGKGGFFQRY